MSASQKFETVVNFLRKKLDCKPADSVFLYVNSVFAPGLDEGVGGLFRVCVYVSCSLLRCFLGSGFNPGLIWVGFGAEWVLVGGISMWFWMLIANVWCDGVVF